MIGQTLWLEENITNLLLLFVTGVTTVSGYDVVMVGSEIVATDVRYCSDHNMMAGSCL